MYLSTCRAIACLGEGAYLLVTSDDNGQTVHIYLVTQWGWTGDEYGLYGWDWDLLSDSDPVEA